MFLKRCFRISNNSYYENFYYNDTLTDEQQTKSFWIDVAFTVVNTGGGMALGAIPYAGPYLAIIVPQVVEIVWDLWLEDEVKEWAYSK